jgi:radical SAM protein with 4Fe4S-binding SPASM domain
MNLKKIQNLPNEPIGKLFNGIRWFKGYSPLLLSVCLNITYRCNLICEFCYQDPKKRETFPDLTLKDAMIIEKNIRGAYSFAPRIHLFGGEPTVNNDFVRILKYFSQKNYIISLTTNGVTLDQYVDELAGTKGLREIIISLNNMNFEKILPALQNFEKFGHKKPHISIACPINHNNQNALIDTIKKLENSPASCVTFQHTTFTTHYNKAIDFNSVRKQVEEIKRNKYKILVLFLPDIKPNDIEKYNTDGAFPYNKNKCLAPWIVPFIQPNGDVLPCDEVDVVVGNVKLQGLRKIWNNEKYIKFRNDIQKFGISQAICQRCCHRQYY